MVLLSGLVLLENICLKWIFQALFFVGFMPNYRVLRYLRSGTSFEKDNIHLLYWFRVANLFLCHLVSREQYHLCLCWASSISALISQSLDATTVIVAINSIYLFCSMV